jgi:hypothetical protein
VPTEQPTGLYSLNCYLNKITTVRVPEAKYIIYLRVERGKRIVG